MKEYTRESTVKQDLYEFDELEIDIQEKTIEQNRYYAVDTNWCDYILYDWQEKLEELGFREPKIYFSGFDAQGDGACFVCKCIEPEKLINFIELFDGKGRHYTLLKRFLEEVELSIEKTQNFYNHANTCTLYYSWPAYFEDYPKALARLEELLEYFKDIRRELCYDIYRDLEQEYAVLTSDATVKEHLRSIGANFLINGKIYS